MEGDLEAAVARRDRGLAARPAVDGHDGLDQRRVALGHGVGQLADAVAVEADLDGALALVLALGGGAPSQLDRDAAGVAVGDGVAGQDVLVVLLAGHGDLAGGVQHVQTGRGVLEHVR
ncbi:hypothetical protein ACFQV2_06080 [Actinokineospora soli]|uniref:Uncharacterized protein n=1 Tax=Actinokineospora soli TaxID=1048753 RepID=A0ABW2THL0_9PSEU